MNRKLIFIAWLALALPSLAAVAQDASARTVQYHSQDIVPIHAKLKYTTLIEVPPYREDHGGRNRRQGFLDCGCGRQLLLCASGQGRHQFQPQPHHRQGQHLFVHFAGRIGQRPMRRT